MSSRREEERNEKIIRGLMKLPPNRRCINCNSLGPQYVCTSFWTFVCITCSGIHREFTHRVKSVSMCKFTSQEVDSLRKGGNERARELFLKAWDKRNKLPDNSKVENIREFIKNVYVNKMYTEMSSSKPPRDPQSLRIQEDETRKASSYHSYSQSPPYDFQYEGRRHGKQAAVLTRKSGPDLGLHEGNLVSFSSPTHLSDSGLADEGPNPGVSDCSVSGGANPFRSEALSPVSQRKFGSPSSETSGDISGEVSQSSESTKSSAGKTFHPQRPTSTGSFGSIDSSFASFKSINPLPEASTGPGHSAEISIKKSVSLPSLTPLSMAQRFNDFDLFSAPFAPNTTNTVMHSTQQSSQIRQTQPLDLSDIQSRQSPSASFNEKASDVVTPDNFGWATFDVPQNAVSVGAENSASFDGSVLGNFNPFVFDPNLDQSPTSHNPFASMNSFVHGNQQEISAAVNRTDLWNVFGDSMGEQLNAFSLHSKEQNAEHNTLEFDNFFDFAIPEVDTPIINQPQTYSFEADLKSTNPFDMPFEPAVESCNVSQVWDVSSLQGALPTTTQMPPISNTEVTDSWFSENPIPSYTPVSGEVPFDSTTGATAGQEPHKQKPETHGQGHATSDEGNPFA